jgi:hypothetical protein
MSSSNYWILNFAPFIVTSLSVFLTYLWLLTSLLFLHDVIKVYYLAQREVMRTISLVCLLLKFFTSFLESSGLELVLVGSLVLEMLWPPGFPMEVMGLILKQSVVLSWTWASTCRCQFSDDKSIYFREAFRGFLCLWPHQLQYWNLPFFLVAFSSWLIFIMGDTLCIPINSY